MIKTLLGVGDLKHSSIVDADWNDYGGCQVVFSSTTMGFDYAAHHRPTGNNALLICLGNNDYYFIQFHIDQNQGIYVRFKDPDHGFSNWEHLITLS